MLGGRQPASWAEGFRSVHVFRQLPSASAGGLRPGNRSEEKWGFLEGMRLRSSVWRRPRHG